MKHQKKTELVVALILWMLFAKLMGGGLFAHMIGIIIGVCFAYGTDNLIKEYEKQRH